VSDAQLGVCASQHTKDCTAPDVRCRLARRHHFESREQPFKQLDQPLDGDSVDVGTTISRTARTSWDQRETVER